MICDYRKKDIVWTTSEYDYNKIGSELPYIHLVEYALSYSAIITNAVSYMGRVAGDRDTVYKGIYKGDETGEYFLPFYEKFHHNISQSWDLIENPLVFNKLGQVQDTAEMIAKLVSPAAGIAKPYGYAGGAEGTFSTRFVLFNTVSEEGINDNRKFIETFIHRNLHDQLNIVAVAPPSFYEILIPGVKWCPACVVEHIDVSNLGTINMIGGRLTPDAWEVTITFKEIIKESRNIYEEIIKDDATTTARRMTVRVI